MFGIDFQHLRVQCPVFHDLGRQFHEIPCYRRSRHFLVRAIGKQTVQGMTEFMEQCFGLVKVQGGGGITGGLGEVAVVGDYRGYILAVLPFLFPEGIHPGTVLFTGPGVIIGIKNSHM